MKNSNQCPTINNTQANLFQSLLQTLPVAVICLNENLVLHYCNPKALILFPILERNKKHVELLKLLPSEQLTSVHLACKAVLVTGKPSIIQWYATSMHQWYQVEIHFENGNLLVYFTETKGIPVDENNYIIHNFWNFINQLPGGIIVADITSKTFEYANETFCKMIGYSAAEIPTLGFINIHSKEDLPMIVSEFEKLSKSIARAAFNIKVIKKNGESFYADIHTIKTVQNNRELLCGIFTDVTERFEERKQLIEANIEAEKNKIIFDQLQSIAAIGYWQKNWSTNTINCSDEIFSILQIDKSAFTINTDALIQLVFLEDREPLLNAYRQHLVEKSIFSFVHRIQTPDKKIKYI